MRWNIILLLHVVMAMEAVDVVVMVDHVASLDVDVAVDHVVVDVVSGKRALARTKGRILSTTKMRYTTSELAFLHSFI